MTPNVDALSDRKVGNRPTSAKRSFAWVGIGFRLFILSAGRRARLRREREWDWWVGSAVAANHRRRLSQADLTPLAAKVPGYVRRVIVHDFQRVKAATCWSRSSTTTTARRLIRRKGNVGAARRPSTTIEQQKRLQEASITTGRGEIQASEADLTRYHLETVRRKTCFGQGSPAPASSSSRPSTTSNAPRQRWRSIARSSTSSVSSSMCWTARRRRRVATLKVQQAARDLARINLGYTRITAPVDGMVGQRQVQDGQYLSVGTQVISIVPLPHVWVIANYKETQMTRIRIGQPARVTVDAFPGVVLHGHVDSWSPASGAQFSLLPPDNATGNFTKVVQRIPVKIVLDPDPAVDDLLRPGMSVIPTIDTR